jgi:uncharacterized membrane protein
VENFRLLISRPWIYIGIALIGISLKFYHIDYRYFWYDEIATIEQTSGNHKVIKDLIPENGIINIGYYKKLLRLNEHDLTIGGQLKNQLNTMNLNPLHYAFLAFWHRIAGDEPVHYRYFSLFIFLLTLPFVYLLAKKLIDFELSGWIAVSLFSVFTYFHYYTHEARYNMLCVFLIISCSYFLLEASDRNQLKWWLGYVVTGIMALYSSAILCFLILGHCLYIFFFRKKIIPSFLISISIIFLVYLPWLIFILNSYTEVSSSLSWHKRLNMNYNAFELIYLQLVMMSRGLVSLFMFNEESGKQFNIPIIVLIVILIFTSIFYAKRKMKRESFYFLLSILLPSFLFFFVTDLIRGAGTSLMERYHYVNYVVLLFFLALFFTRKISNKKLMFFALYVCIIVFGIISNIRISQSKNWGLSPTFDFSPVRYIENAERCLLISDFTAPGKRIGVTMFLMIINEIKTKNVDILYTSPDDQQIESKITKNKYTAIYVLYASEKLLDNLKSQFENQLIQIESPELYYPFWQIKNNTD